MNKMFTQAPLPFQGQKRRWNKEFKKALKEFGHCDVFVDLFGGSGILSRMVADERPDARVVYNDFDDYHVRLNNTDKTNLLLADIREIVGESRNHRRIKKEHRDAIIERVKQEEDNEGYVDYITLSASIVFSVSYATCFEDLKKISTFYNRIKSVNYSTNGYLDGITLVKEDYKDLFNRYSSDKNVVFLIDPPYLSTDCTTYSSYWKLSQYLDTLRLLKDTNYFYFTSSKSSVIDLCDWVAGNYEVKSPFYGATKIEQNTNITKVAKYTDIMLYKKQL